MKTPSRKMYLKKKIKWYFFCYEKDWIQFKAEKQMKWWWERDEKYASRV